MLCSLTAHPWAADLLPGTPTTDVPPVEPHQPVVTLTTDVLSSLGTAAARAPHEACRSVSAGDTKGTEQGRGPELFLHLQNSRFPLLLKECDDGSAGQHSTPLQDHFTEKPPRARKVKAKPANHTQSC